MLTDHEVVVNTSVDW